MRRWSGISGRWIGLALLLGAGCGRFDTLDRDLSELGQYGTAHIELKNETGRESQCVVMLLNTENNQVSNKLVMLGSGEVQVVVLAGTYFAAAFEDLNENMEYDADELGVFVGTSEPIVIGGEATDVDIVLELHPDLGGSQSEQLAEHLGAVNSELAYLNVGNVVSLDDPRFDPDTGKLGMWEPSRFIAKRLHGLYMLDEYDRERTPVIFVHGIGGTPREFAAMIDSMDHELFQAWVLYYPSALELQHLSDGMYELLQVMQRTYRPEKVILVAHSMGGLIATAVVQRYIQESPFDYLKLFVTLSAPLGGLTSAQLGVDYAPTVMPCWEGLAPGSEFLDKLYPAQEQTVPYCLFFSYHRSGFTSLSGDGTVPLSSQLRDEAQERARHRLFGIDSGHREILSHPDTLREINALFVEFG